MEETKFAEFVAAQNQCYDRVRRELGAGSKQTHWIWFIFPQLAGLGSSAMAVKFALGSLDEARCYFQHPILGPRLLECIQLILAIPNRRIDSILGFPDNLKLHSCLTLFAIAEPKEPLFRQALEKYFNGTHDPGTIKILGTSHQGI